MSRATWMLVLVTAVLPAAVQAQTSAATPAAAVQAQTSAATPAAAAVQAQTSAATPAAAAVRTPDVIYVPTPQPVVEAMLEMAGVKKGDVLYDLGSGDGRIPITAAKNYGVRAIGIDIDPQRIAEASQNAQTAGVAGLVTFRNADLFASDFSEATVVTLYLLDSLNEKLRPKLLRELKPGTRIVSHAFRMGDWKPEQEREVNGRMIYMWTVPGTRRATGR